jgi:transcriptional regulator with XRE-family HTH domain
MSIPASFGATDSSERRRFTARRKLHLQSKLISGVGLDLSVEVLNLSLSGMLLKTGNRLGMGEKILVHFETAVQRAATIVWSSNQLYGCRFDQQLSKGQLSAAQLRSTSELTPLLSLGPQIGVNGWPVRGIEGSELARMRKASGMTQSDLASRIGVSKTTVWKWENGAATPRRVTAARLAQLLTEALPASSLLTANVDVKSGEREESHRSADLEAIVARCKEAIAQAVGTTIDRITIQIQI